MKYITFLAALRLSTSSIAVFGQNSDFVSVTACHLVDTKQALDLFELFDGVSYDTDIVGDRLTIRCEVDFDTEYSWVKFDLDDGRTVRTDQTTPYVLAGKNENSGNFFNSHLLNIEGKHTLKACPVNTGAPVELPPRKEQEQRPYKPGKGPASEQPNTNNGQTSNSQGNSPENNLANQKEDPEDPDKGQGRGGRFAGLLNRNRERNGFLSTLMDRIREDNGNERDGLFDREDGSVNRERDDNDGVLSNVGNMLSNFLSRDKKLLGNRHLEEIDDRTGCLSLTFYVGGGGGIEDFPPTPAPAPVTDVSSYPSHPMGELSGKLSQWSKITIGFEGPEASESGTSFRGFIGDRPSSVFADYVADVTFFHEGGESFVVPAYFAGDGNAANEGGESGNVWLCHFVPPKAGAYQWKVKFSIGGNVAANGGVDSADHFDGESGDFVVAKASPDVKGRLQYVGKHHFQFASSQQYLFETGPDSPANILAFEDFDNTSSNNGYLKFFEKHESDYMDTDPTWKGGKGVGLIGAINYLASQGVTTLSVTTLTIDGKISPFVNIDSGAGVWGYDISKLAQWDIVLSHAASLGMVARIKLQDSGSNEILDNGNTYDERTVYFREMIARFGHLNVIWDLGEEITDVEEIIKRSELIKKLDPYNSPIVVNALEGSQEDVYMALLGVESIDGVSISSRDLSEIGSLTQKWIVESAKAGHPWVVTSNEQGDVSTGLENATPDTVRTEVLWGNIMAGGAGVQYYLGSSLGSQLEDFEVMQPLFQQSAAAQSILNNFPFWDMRPSSTIDMLGLSREDVQVLADAQGSNMLVYTLPTINAITLSLPGPLQRSYTTEWYNPRTGESNGDIRVVNGGLPTVVAMPTGEANMDWVISIQCQSGCATSN